MMRILKSNGMPVLLAVLSYSATTVLCWHTPMPAAAESEMVESSRPAEPSWNFRNPEITQLVLDLSREREAVTQRQAQLDELASRLQAERQELNQVTQNVFRMQREFDRNVLRIRDEETANLKKLAKIYATMSPDGATTILKEMEEEQIVKIMVFMKENETAPILETLAKSGTDQAKRAALISERLRLSISRPSTASNKTKTP
jgi:flagellar motility protein MotE (MotC chaperone)